MKNDNKKNILLISPYESAVGGITKWTHNVIDYYNQTSSCVSIEILPVDREDNIKLLKSKAQRIVRGVRAYVYLAFKAWAILSKGFDVVHICSSASFGLIKDYVLISISKWRGAKTIIHFHFGRIPDLFKERNLEWWLLSRIVNMADGTIVLDQSSYDTLLGSGFLNVYKIPNPLDVNIKVMIDSSLSVSTISNKILFVGHCYRDKGVLELVEACSNVSNITLSMIGRISDEMRNTLMEYDQEGKWLQIIGEQPFSFVINEMISCGIFVLPTYSEGFPNVILEAMACGCPIVTTDVGAIPEMLDIDGDNNYGICVKPKDVDGLRVAINKMLDDRPYAIKCGNNARRRVNDLYSMPKVWEQLVRLWTTL